MGEPITDSMKATELKSLVEAGSYKPDPSRVASAMLRRRGVRELLTGAYGGGADRTPRSGPLHHRAA
ncbi:MAG: flagellar biosynthesis anti-sigma factor FlgM [Actinobacteria bacterium]|nr:flagellar biosynthesis anti-sigma factor FlgM [Actinomycetota bacterium]